MAGRHEAFRTAAKSLMGQSRNKKSEEDRRANKIIEKQIVDRNYVNAQRLMINLWTVPFDCFACSLSMMIM